MTEPVGPPIGTLFSAASIPFTIKPDYHLKSFHLLKKRKRTITKPSDENVSSVSSNKRHKHEEDRINSGVIGAVTECNASDNDGMSVEHNSSNDVLTEALDVSEFYATAAESFGNADNTVFTSPQENISKNNRPKMWRKQKRCNNDDDMFFISRKKLKTNSNVITKKSKQRIDKGKSLKRFVAVFVVFCNSHQCAFYRQGKQGKTKRYFLMR